MDHHQEQQNEYMFARHEEQQAQHQERDATYHFQQYGRNSSHHMPQNYSYYQSEQHQTAGLSFHHGKRARDPPSVSEGDTGMQDCFKRLKVVDEAGGTNTGPLYSALNSISSIDIANTPVLREEYPLPSPPPAQTPGQQSCEPSTAEYQSMNSMLGNLHLLRQHRVAQPPAQPSSTGTDYYYSAHQTPRPPPRNNPPTPLKKKPVSLRISSKLF
jgi:hypothetical protein